MGKFVDSIADYASKCDEVKESVCVLAEANKMRYDNADSLLSENIIDFNKSLQSYSINDLMAIKSALNMIKGEMTYKANKVMQNRYVNINMTEEEYSTFCSFLVSIGGMINNCDDKLAITEECVYNKTPDCFKNKDIQISAENV
jgi:hypothetical protein